MITYCASNLTRQFEVSIVTVHLLRQPLDPVYGHFVVDLLNTTQYDACFAKIIVELGVKGKSIKIPAAIFISISLADAHI